MKKIIIISLIMFFTTSSAFAGEELDTTAQAGGGKQILAAITSTSTTAPLSNLSTKVQLTAQYSDLGYAIATVHLSGTKAYGTGFDSTKIFWLDMGQPTETRTLAVPSSSVASVAFTDWTPM